MPLPILETPKYEMTLPSTGKKLTYRPYLVKEEKLLMIAIESEDQKQIMQAMKDTVASCTFNKIDPNSLAIFDLEYIFLKLRAKSVGEIAKIGVKCVSCEKTTSCEVNIDDIKINVEEKPSNKIKLSDNIGVIMRWPSVEFVTDIGAKSKEDQKSVAFDVVVHCIESIFDEKKIYPASEQSQKEMLEFIESLNQSQFQKIQEFIEKMPKLEKEISFTCKHCQKNNTVVLKGLQNFF